MVASMAGRGNFKGWIDPADVDPELLDKLDRFHQRIGVHLKGSLPSGNGTADTLGAHRKALADVPLTLRDQRTGVLFRIEGFTNPSRQAVG